DGKRVDLDATDVDQLGAAADEVDAITAELDEVAGRPPFVGKGLFPKVAQHAVIGADVELVVDDAGGRAAIGAGVQERGGEAFAVVTDGGAASGFGGGEDLGDAGAGEVIVEPGDEVGGNGFAAKRDLLDGERAGLGAV